MCDYDFINWNDFKVSEKDIPRRDLYVMEIDNTHCIGRSLKRGLYNHLRLNQQVRVCHNPINLYEVALLSVEALLSEKMILFFDGKNESEYDPVLILLVVEDIIRQPLFSKRGNVYKKFAPARIKKNKKILEKYMVRAYYDAPLYIYSSDVEYVIAPRIYEDDERASVIIIR